MLYKISNYDTLYGPIGPLGDPNLILLDCAVREAGSTEYKTKSFPLAKISALWRPGDSEIAYQDTGLISRAVRVLQKHKHLAADGLTFVEGPAETQLEIRYAYANNEHPEQVTAAETRLPIFEATTTDIKIMREDFTWTAGQVTSITTSEIAAFTIPLIP